MNTPYRKRVLLVHTGGTLGMALPDHHRLDLAPEAHLQRLLTRVPELSEIADITLLAPWNLDSSDVGPDQWQKLAEIIAKEGGAGQPGKGYDGIVIIHGTDTMAYAASALAFMLRGLDRPVVVTGSQRPLEAWRTDARANLAAAVEVATLDIPEVLVVFGDKVLRGCRSSKVDAEDYQAFDTPNDPPLGRIGVTVHMDTARVRRPSEAFRLATEVVPAVLGVTLFPGFDPDLVVQSLVPTVIRGLVLRGFGVGNVPMRGRASVLPMIERLSSQGVAVVVTSQCPRGRTDLDMYASGRALLSAGAIQARDMTFEAAITKTMWALGQRHRTVANWFRNDLAGEASGTTW